ncbi:hypothetical protein AB0N81_31445 [Streptomyces sp. NPDC093510]|uniref:hypothetical protein n=1 Tax=Streptomyces sp. NPDC093510 TaxID=3155199 RepID=UPI003443F5AA
MSYNVRSWDIRERPDRRKPYMARWTVNGREESESFMTIGLAGSRHAKLLTAAREGEPFDEHTGLPASELRAIKQRTTWYDLAHEYIDQRRDRTPGNTRRTLADAFATGVAEGPGLAEAKLFARRYSCVDPAACARRAGQSIEVLFRNYAKFLDGVREQANCLIEQSMWEWDRASREAAPEG